jgi:hypothetical protein
LGNFIRKLSLREVAIQLLYIDVFIGREEAGQLGYSLFICDKVLTFDIRNEGE